MFTPEVFFGSVLKLTSIDSFDGVDILFDQFFDNQMDQKSPTDSAFSQFRNSISYDFFKNTYDGSLAGIVPKLPTWNGFRFTGIDGDQLTLYRTKELEDMGYTGSKISDNEESYGLKMYIVLATDLITGAPIAFKESKTNDELALACKIVEKSDSSDIYVYDRLYFCKQLIQAHKTAGSYFVCRLKEGGTFKVVQEFAKSGKKKHTVSICGVKIRLIRVGKLLYATNTTPSMLSDCQVSDVYARRQTSENANRENTVFLGLDHFHGRSYNKIMQEIYACLWLRLICSHICSTQVDFASDFLSRLYKRPNSKRVLRLFIDNFWSLVSSSFAKLSRLFSEKITKSIETRVQGARNYAKKLKYSRKGTYKMHTKTKSVVT